MGVMADKGAGGRPPRQRLKTLTQAAMNADVTVNQLEDVLGGLGDTLTRSQQFALEPEQCGRIASTTAWTTSRPR